MVTIYTTETCPRCKVLKMKLADKGISYIELKDLQKLRDNKIREVPVLEVENKLLKFSDAIEWINNQ